MFHDNPNVYDAIKRVTGMKKKGFGEDDVREWVNHEYPSTIPVSMLGSGKSSITWRPERFRQIYENAIQNVYYGVPVPPKKKVGRGEFKKLEKEVEMLEEQQKIKELIKKRDELISKLRDEKQKDILDELTEIKLESSTAGRKRKATAKT